MKIAVITIAGISSRFNENIPENEKKLKAIFCEGDYRDTLLYHLIQKCMFADKIILVSGYKAESLKEYVNVLENKLKEKIFVVFNKCFQDLGSGYSLYLGLEEAFKYSVDEVTFVEGDLDVDIDSFEKVVCSSKSVLTYTNEPIFANKAVVLYKDDCNRYRYAFNSNHGLLTIDSPFSFILNSGQIWKFTEIETLKRANQKFICESKADTNLRIIQNYLDSCLDVELIQLNRWTNCNTRNDYKKIVSYWENEA